MKRSARQNLEKYRKATVARLAESIVRQSVKDRLGFTVHEWVASYTPLRFDDETRNEFQGAVLSRVADHYLTGVSDKSHPLHEADQHARRWAGRHLSSVAELAKTIDASENKGDIWSQLREEARDGQHRGRSLPSVSKVLEREFPYSYRDPDTHIADSTVAEIDELLGVEGLAQLDAALAIAPDAPASARIKNLTGEHDLIGTFSASTATDSDGNLLDPVMDDVSNEFGYLVRQAAKAELDETFDNHPELINDQNWIVLAEELDDTPPLHEPKTPQTDVGMPPRSALPTATSRLCGAKNRASGSACRNLVRLPATRCWLHGGTGMPAAGASKSGRSRLGHS